MFNETEDVSVELSSLTGLHRFSGLDVEMLPARDTWSDPYEVYWFILDGVTYRIEEDPSDGYRSNANGPYIDKEYKVKNVFTPVIVEGAMRPDDSWEKNDVLVLTDVSTHGDVLEIGTANIDDYYPSFVANYSPENMVVNRAKK